MKKISKIKKWIIGSFIVLSFPVFFAFNDDVDFEIVKNLDIYYSLFRELNVYYVDEIKPSEVIKKSIDAMLSTLDPYTIYIPESQIEDFRFMTTGQYGGVGAIIMQRDKEIMISETYEGYPAQKSNLSPGDVILEIDGKSVQGKNVSEISEWLKGQPNSEITIKVKKAVSNIIEIKKIKREEIKIKNVPYYGLIDDNIGYIYLANFTENASTEVANAFKELKEKGAKKLILDLRGNPGGLLMEAVNLMSLFVPKGTLIVSTKGRVKDWDKDYYSTIQPLDIEIPIAILTNSGSASASEIIAGAMQDLDRGVVIGQRTFGKGLVQTTRDLSYNAKLKITTAKYYTPSGRCIQAIDYSHRNPDGSVGKIPDSLMHPFKTKIGRTVFDGGGIAPDKEVQPEELSPIAMALIENHIIFDFANQFYATYPSMNGLNNIIINDKIYQDFIAFASLKKFSYTTQSEELIEELAESLRKDKYYDIAKTDVEHLKKEIELTKQNDFKLFETEIKQLLFEEIAERYYFQKGRILAMLRNDPVMFKAKEILNNPDAYKKVLSN
ncbi:MAG: S41 family peptidase [Bacteroidales bacterium]|nr:S41 family peptidase [Bacteroidales bacterium]